MWLANTQVRGPGTASEVVVRGGVEPPTFRFSGAFAVWLDVAGCGLMGDLAAQTMAGCRLLWPDVCRRWLPVWLSISLAPLTFDTLSSVDRSQCNDEPTHGWD